VRYDHGHHSQEAAMAFMNCESEMAQAAPPAADNIEKIRDAIRQRDAIFALEGFEPTEQTRAIDAAVLAGRVTRTQVAEEMRDFAIRHKTTDGFVESRAWAKSRRDGKLLHG
jgi:hypothetical protein